MNKKTPEELLNIAMDLANDNKVSMENLVDDIKNMSKKDKSNLEESGSLDGLKLSADKLDEELSKLSKLTKKD